jgi:hypothetical protein
MQTLPENCEQSKKALPNISHCHKVSGNRRILADFYEILQINDKSVAGWNSQYFKPTKKS